MFLRHRRKRYCLSVIHPMPVPVPVRERESFRVKQEIDQSRQKERMEGKQNWV